MGKYFALLLSISILMILAASGGTYWMSAKEIERSRHDAANATASGIAARIGAQIDAINTVLDNMGRDPRIIAAIGAGDKAQLKILVGQFEPLLPGIMKLRLLLPDENATDASSVPAMGFADVDMVRDTFNDNPSPMVQGEDANRHLAVARGVKIEQRVAAVLLASLKFDFLSSALLAQQQLPFFIQLEQDGVTLTSAGDTTWKQTAVNAKLAVPNTLWLLQYWYPFDKKFHDSGLFWALLMLPILLTCLLFFLGYRKFITILRGDQSNILRFIKDLLLGRPQGNYPVNFDELRIIISSVMQFKRIKDAENIVPDTAAESDETASLSSFFHNAELHPDVLFSDEPMRADAASSFSDSDMDMDAAHVIRETIAAQKKSEQFLEASISGKKPKDAMPLPSSITTDATVESFSMPKIPLPDDDFFTKPAITGSIFRAYDIRGIVGKTLTKEIVYDIGRALGSEAKESGCQGIVVGRDGRNSSQGLTEALNKGIASTGLNILDIGLVPTPALYFVTHHYPGQSGVMITGGHNPPQYNGIKIVVNGTTLAGESIQKLRQRIDQQDFASGAPGSITENELFANEYIGMISENVHLGRPMKIVVDCGNGAAGKVAPLLLKTLGCEVIELFCDIDGNFPNHHPDPSKPENLADVIAAVRHYEAEVGLAFDGDGDRLGVVDSSGKIIWPDRQMMLFAKDVLAAKHGAEIIYDVKCSRHLAAQIKQYGGRPLLWKTGHSLMKAKLQETGAKLAGEMSGHIFFNDRWFGFDDALYAAARLIEILSADTRASSEVFADFPDSVNTPELNVILPEGENVKIVQSLLAAAQFSDAEIVTIDGLRADFRDGWGLVRASNTTPSLMLRFEADNAAALGRIQARFKELLLQIKPDLDLPF